MNKIIVPLNKDNDVTIARDEAAAIAHTIGFDNVAAAQVMLAVSEICQNVIRYAQRGQAEISVHNHGRVLRILVTDQGPGIPDTDLAMQEGFSSTPTSWGVGLKAAKNSMDRFEIKSEPEAGTRVLLEKYLPLSKTVFDFGAASLPDENYIINGDEFIVKQFDGDKVFLGVIDGLGQGQPAQQMALIVKSVLQEYYRMPLPELIQRCNEQLQKDIDHQGGVAMSVAVLTPGQLSYLGIGDTHAYLHNGPLFPIPNIEGRVGGRQLRTLKVSKYNFDGTVILILCTDGIYNRIEPQEIDFGQPAQQMANQIFNLYNRPYGDATVLVAKYNAYDSP